MLKGQTASIHCEFPWIPQEMNTLAREMSLSLDRKEISRVKFSLASFITCNQEIKREKRIKHKNPTNATYRSTTANTNHKLLMINMKTDLQIEIDTAISRLTTARSHQGKAPVSLLLLLPIPTKTIKPG